jgi:CRP-like cAMP-binding protein
LAVGWGPRSGEAIALASGESTQLSTGRENMKNRILVGLSPDDFALLSPSLTPVDLPARKILEARHRRIDQVYFPECGLASIVANTGANHSIEIGVVGSEGMTGLSVLMATDRSPHETFMQSAGHGWRIAATDLRIAMAQSATLRDRFLRYGHTLVVQMGFSALANGRYKLEERLARWLLMAQDRCNGGAEVALTHESLAVMLGTRRPGITTALNEMEKTAILRSQRGLVTILDRHALEETANGSYGGAEAEYARLFGAA